MGDLGLVFQRYIKGKIRPDRLRPDQVRPDHPQNSPVKY